MTTLRDEMDFDNSRSVSRKYLEERERIEREHATIGEPIGVAHLETDGSEMSQIRAVLENGHIPKPQEVPSDNDSIWRLREWGLQERQVGSLEKAGINTIAQLRVALKRKEIRYYRQCGKWTERSVGRTLARVDEAKH